MPEPLCNGARTRVAGPTWSCAIQWSALARMASLQSATTVGSRDLVANCVQIAHSGLQLRILRTARIPRTDSQFWRGIFCMMRILRMVGMRSVTQCVTHRDLDCNRHTTWRSFALGPLRAHPALVSPGRFESGEAGDGPRELQSNGLLIRVSRARVPAPSPHHASARSNFP